VHYFCFRQEAFLCLHHIYIFLLKSLTKTSLLGFYACFKLLGLIWFELIGRVAYFDSPRRPNAPHKSINVLDRPTKTWFHVCVARHFPPSLRSVRPLVHVAMIDFSSHQIVLCFPWWVSGLKAREGTKIVSSFFPYVCLIRNMIYKEKSPYLDLCVRVCVQASVTASVWKSIFPHHYIF